MISLPSFDLDEVKLLVVAVQKTLEHLRKANEQLGGKDVELMQTGRRYALLLQKLQAALTTDLCQAWWHRDFGFAYSCVRSEICDDLADVYLSSLITVEPVIVVMATAIRFRITTTTCTESGRSCPKTGQGA